MEINTSDRRREERRRLISNIIVYTAVSMSRLALSIQRGRSLRRCSVEELTNVRLYGIDRFRPSHGTFLMLSCVPQNPLRSRQSPSTFLTSFWNIYENRCHGNEWNTTRKWKTKIICKQNSFFDRLLDISWFSVVNKTLPGPSGVDPINFSRLKTRADSESACFSSSGYRFDDERICIFPGPIFLNLSVQSVRPNLGETERQLGGRNPRPECLYRPRSSCRLTHRGNEESLSRSSNSRRRINLIIKEPTSASAGRGWRKRPAGFRPATAKQKKNNGRLSV